MQDAIFMSAFHADIQRLAVEIEQLQAMVGTGRGQHWQLTSISSIVQHSPRQSVITVKNKIINIMLIIIIVNSVLLVGVVGDCA